MEKCNRQNWVLALLFVLMLNKTVAATTWIDFSGLSVANLPETFTYPGGSVTVSQLSSPVVGSPSLIQYLPTAGTNGRESPTGGMKMAILGTGTGPDTWEIQLAFSQSQAITVHNTETYCNFEDTILTSTAPWTQTDLTSGLNVSGLGSDTLSLVGTNGASGPFGYGHWSTTTTTLDMSYTLNEAPGGSAGNGIEISVPEPTSMSIFAVGIGLLLNRKRVCH